MKIWQSLRQPRIAFRHIASTPNVGDRASGPYRYFDFPEAVVQHKTGRGRRPRTLIYGGGLLFGLIERQIGEGAAQADRRIAWGIGVTRPADCPRRTAVAAQFDLFGVRDYPVPEGQIYVPCVSCMDPFFDDVPAPETEIVLYAHAEKSEGLVRMDGVPERSNHDGTLSEALSFIARGRTVVSNSYHGTYWALLMGRRVLCLPFNPKFRGFKMKPGYSTKADWPGDLDKAVAQPAYLSDCRARTLEFHRRVRDLLEKAA